MGIYHYKGTSPVDEITFVATEKGGSRAYLHAREKGDPAQFQAIIDHIHNKGWQTVPFDLAGKPVLEVRGYDKDKKLIHVLEEKGAVQGAPVITKDKPLSYWERFKKRTLQASGVSYLIGDYGFFKYNLKEADRLGVMGAVCYFLGTLSLVGYGRNDQSDLQVRDMTKSLEHFLTKEKIVIPENCAFSSIAKERKQTTLQALDEFARRYPSEIFNTVTALAGVFVAASASKKVLTKYVPGADLQAFKKLKLEGWMDVGLGTLTAASGVLATVVKEKKPDPDEPPAKGGDWLWQKVQAHPLAIAGIGYTMSTMCHAASTFVAYKEAKRVNDPVRMSSVPGRALFVGAAFLSEFLLAISSKGHGEGVTSDESVGKSVYAIAAEMIAKQKPELREWHLQHMAGFLQQPNILAESYDEVEKTLRQEVAKVQKNPWLCTGRIETPVSEVLPEKKVMAHTPGAFLQPHSIQQSTQVQMPAVQAV